jgi:flavin reductase (DIM6/NTAB) family NADH-FMN oxidoreductase RutF
MSGLGVEEYRRALSALARSTFLMTSSFETKRSGVVVNSVQMCAEQPPLVCVALRKGHSISTIIRDSRRFALCGVDASDRVLMKRFSGSRAPDATVDPFDWVEMERMASGAPVLKGSATVLDCEVFRHFDLEADHELYVGLVLGGRCA